MVLVCHVILEDHVTRALKSVIAIFSKAHVMSYSHIRNFTIKVALTKIFASVSNDSSLILVTPSYVTIDEIHAKTARGRKRRKKKTRNAIAKLLTLRPCCTKPAILLKEGCHFRPFCRSAENFNVLTRKAL